MLKKILKYILKVILIFCACITLTLSVSVPEAGKEVAYSIPEPIYPIIIDSIPPQADVLALRSRIDEIISEYTPNGFFYGMKVISLDLPQVLYEHHSEIPFIPASNLKIITSAAALHLLHPEFRFETSFYLNNRGDVYVKGSGDPTWNDRWTLTKIDRIFEAIADSLISNGFLYIAGNFIIESDRYMDVPLNIGWSKRNRSQPYSAKPSNMAFYDNTVNVRVAPTTVGDTASVAIFPTEAGFELRNNVYTTRARRPQPLHFAVDSLDNIITVSGQISTRSNPVYRSFAVPRPDLYTLAIFSEKLAEAGVRVRGDIIRGFITEEHLIKNQYIKLFTIYSPPLKSIIGSINRYSNNFTSNQVFLAIGSKQKRLRYSEEIIKIWLNRYKINTDTLIMSDGSGLSTYNRCSVETLIQTLHLMYVSPYFEEFFSSLAVTGVSGTLRNYTDETITGKVFAKTGYILGARALSGYAITADNETLAFSIILNRQNAPMDYFKEMSERILVELTQFTRDNALN